MNVPVRGGELVADGQLSPLFRAWLAGRAGRPGASEEWRRCVAGPLPAAGPAPAWAAAAWRDRWLAELLADQPDEAARRLCADQVAQLAAGRAEVVVTGQQPGFLGGPLYTLYKAAAAVAAAAARTAAGRPTVPLFWFGDDDDDRVEAFAPWLWDPARGAWLRAVPPDGPADQMVGAGGAAWSAAEAAWLAGRQARGGLGAELAAIWNRARGEGLGWGRLQRRALLRLFAGSGLLAVSGNDAQLHAVAAPFYAALWPRRAALAQLARSGGEALVAAGFHAQLGEGSLVRPLHLAAEGRRLTLSAEIAGAPSPPAAAALRPGVLLRSPVQDWLFRPAGVVVGPGELAYLVQMQGVYDDLGLPRAPLLPRLFACAVPQGVAGEPAPDVGTGVAPADWLAVATTLVGGTTTALAAALAGAGLAAERATQLAARETARWREGAARLLAREAAAARGAAAGLPPWVRPFGRRQERTLALHGATALWGEAFVAAARAAARQHFAAGEQGNWREFALPVPPPE
ncbi:MAG: bacillithiol biosynthesis protein BshC [Candidatus Krumholzibacteriia bacterium]